MNETLKTSNYERTRRNNSYEPGWPLGYVHLICLTLKKLSCHLCQKGFNFYLGYFVEKFYLREKSGTFVFDAFIYVNGQQSMKLLLCLPKIS